MKTSKLRMFVKLYKKDIHDIKFESLIFIAAVALWNIFLYYKSISGWPYEMSLGLSTIAFGVAAFVPFIESFKLLQNEWKNNTLYLIMSLPVSGNIVLLSKLAVILTQYIIFGLFSGICFILLSLTTPMWGIMGEIISETIPNTHILVEISLVTLIGIIVVMIYTTVLVFFSSVVGKLVKKFSGLTTLLTFLAGGYIFSRITGLLTNSIADIYYVAPDLHSVATSNVLPILIPNLAVSILIFVVTSKIYEKRIEL